MNSFWDNQYDRFKDRHYAAVFWSTLMVLFGLLALGGIIAVVLSGLGIQQYFLEALAGIGILGLAWGFLKFRQARVRSQEKLPRGPLARDELRVARSKLRNGMKPIHRPAPKAPDTFLKY